VQKPVISPCPEYIRRTTAAVEKKKEAYGKVLAVSNMTRIRRDMAGQGSRSLKIV
jgi:hypothetical protein